MFEPNAKYHLPVLLTPVLDAARGARRVVDATLGDGGHAVALLGIGAQVLGIDRDPQAIAISRSRLGESHIQYLQAPYGSPEALETVARFDPDFILFDLGVSSRQLDDEGRGFTFRPGAPLDMRMGPADDTAALLLNEAGALPSSRFSGTTETNGEPGVWRPRSCDAGSANASARATTWSTPSALFWGLRVDQGTSPDLPGRPDRGEWRAGRPGAGSSSLSRCTQAGRKAVDHYLSFRRRSAGEAHFPQLECGLRLSARPSSLCLRLQATGPGSATQARDPCERRAGGQSAIEERQTPNLRRQCFDLGGVTGCCCGCWYFWAVP